MSDAFCFWGCLNSIPVGPISHKTFPNLFWKRDYQGLSNIWIPGICVCKRLLNDTVLLCYKIISLPGWWKGQAQQIEEDFSVLWQNVSIFKVRPWTCKVTNSFRLQTITLTQLLVFKITNLSDVGLVHDFLVAVTENWRLALDWQPALFVVNNIFKKLLQVISEVSDFKTKWKMRQKTSFSFVIWCQYPSIYVVCSFKYSQNR